MSAERVWQAIVFLYKGKGIYLWEETDFVKFGKSQLFKLTTKRNFISGAVLVLYVL